VAEWDVDIDDAGNAAVAWVNPTRRGGMAYRPAGGAWSSPSPLAGTSPAIALDGLGTATFAYVETEDSETRHVVAVRRLPDGRFGPREILATSGGPGFLDAAGDPAGNVLVAWSESVDRRGIYVAQWDARAPAVRQFKIDRANRRFEYGVTEPARLSIDIERLRDRPTRVTKFSFRSATRKGVRPIDDALAKRLRKGTYRATVVARDSAGRRSKPRQVQFAALPR
jgi:hypothetical protein